RPAEHEGVSYVEMVRFWNTAKPKKWVRWPDEDSRIPLYLPIYKSKRTHSQYPDFCRVKLMLNRPHRKEEELLVFGDRRFDTYVEAFDQYLLTDEYERLCVDGYGQPESEEVEVEPSQFEPGAEPDEEADLNLEDWQELARMVPEMGPA